MKKRISQTSSATYFLFFISLLFPSMFPSIDGRKKDSPTKNPLHRNCWIYKRFLELAESLDSLASTGKDTEDVESDLKMSMLA